MSDDFLTPAELQAGLHSTSLQARRESQEAGWVRFLVKRLNLGRVGYEAVQAASQSLFGYSGLSFTAFDQAYPDFPIRLVGDSLADYLSKDARGLHLDPAALFPSMYRTFRATPFARAYTQARKESPASDLRPMGLVFPRIGFAPPAMIIHNAGAAYGEKGGDFTYRDPEESLYWHVQPYQVAVDAIRDSGWEPGYLPESESASEQQED